MTSSNLQRPSATANVLNANVYYRSNLAHTGWYIMRLWC